jgi:hypothetical protein
MKSCLPKRPSDFALESLFWQRHRNISLLACQNLWAIEVATIGDDIEVVSIKNVFRLQRHRGKLRAIRAGIRHLVRDDQMMLCIHRYLNVVADNARTAPPCRHRA